MLFDRRGHRAVLTKAGREWLREGRHLLAAVGELECRVRQIAKGWEAVVAANTLLPIAPLLELLAQPEIAAGRFIEKQPEEGKPTETLYLAWCAAHRGKALAWVRTRRQGIAALRPCGPRYDCTCVITRRCSRRRSAIPCRHAE